jgi:predicted transposase YdaD
VTDEPKETTAEGVPFPYTEAEWLRLREKAEAQRESEDYTVWREGIRKGHRKGIREGHRKGIREGRAQGIREAQEATIRRGLEFGYSLPDIAKMTGLDLTEIQRVASQ